MIILQILWILINILLICLILIRSPNEQSLQEILGPLQFFDSSGSAEKNLDKIIWGLICLYFVLGLSFTSKFVS
jgi:protein translocase SecG subunit